MKKLISFITIMLVIGLFSIPVSATTRLANGQVWLNTPRDVFFYCNMPSSQREAVRSAMQKWNSIKTPDGDNMVSMYLTSNESSTNNSVAFDTSFNSWVGYTDSNYDWDTGEIYSVNIYLNTNYSWSVGGNSGTYDVQTVTQHELGHALGVAHCHEQGESDPCWSSTCNSNVMYRAISNGEVRTKFQPYDTSSYINIYW